MAQAVAGHAAAEAVLMTLQAEERILDVEPGHRALHGAKGLVHLRARAEVEACVGLASRATGVPVINELLAVGPIL